MNQKVLVVEDEPGVAQNLKRIICENGSEAIISKTDKNVPAILAKKRFSLIITDITLKGVKSEKDQAMNYIKNLQSVQEAPPIVVLTSQTESDLIIDSFKNGVHDYLIKPLTKEKLREKVVNALEYSHLKVVKQKLEKENRDRLRERLAWHSWKEGIISSERNKFEQSFFHNLRVALSQGAGFGMLLSLLAGLPNPDPNKEQILLDSNILELLRVNERVAHRTIDVFTKLDSLSNDSIPMDRISLLGFHELLTETNKELAPYRALNSQRVIITTPGNDLKNSFVQYNREYIQIALRELFLNAFKYSKFGSEIYVLLNCSDREMHLAILNYPRDFEESSGGIPPQLEKTVFEPFARLVSTVDERYDTLDYGLGLTMVEKIVHRHNGQIEITNVIEHINPESKNNSTLLSLNVSIPLE